MASCLSAKTLLRKHVSRRDHILLVNPPVQDTRYAWLHWNQPFDLLRIGSFLKRQVGCSADLIDFMKPDAEGNVPQQRLPGDRQNRTVGTGDFAHRYPIWRFGDDYDALSRWLVERRASGAPVPTQVWITSLCSYWYQSVVQVSCRARQHFQGSSIVLLGNYPRLMPDHAAEYCATDFVVTEPLETADATADFDLYGERMPPFVAVAPNVQTAVPEIIAAVERGVTDIAFFSDNVAADGGHELAEIVAKTQNRHRHLKYHVVCGLHPADVTPRLAKTLAFKRFANVHFEEASDGCVIDREAYVRAIHYFQEAGATIPSRVFSGFVWIGRPEEQLEEIIDRCLDVLQLVGTFVFKPYSPTPGSDAAIKYAKYLPGIERHEDLSPHFFPFAELNGITREDYSDLYRLAAFLNEKVRGQSFDLLRGTLGEKFLKESLRREVWKLESSTLSIID